MEVNILSLVNKSSQTTKAVGRIVKLPKLCIDELHVTNNIKATCILKLNRQICANE